MNGGMDYGRGQRAGNSTSERNGKLPTEAFSLGLSPPELELLSSAYGIRSVIIDALDARDFKVTRECDVTGTVFLKHREMQLQAEVREGFVVMEPDAPGCTATTRFLVKDSRTPKIVDGVIDFALDLTPAVVIAAPTPSFVTQTIRAIAALPDELKGFKGILPQCAASAQKEIVDHEFVHLGDMYSGSPWGKVSLQGLVNTNVVSHCLTNGVDPAKEAVKISYRIPTNLPPFRGEPFPSTAERQAAMLISELRAFAVGPSSMPQATMAATRAFERIERSRLKDEGEIRASLEEWRVALSRETAYEARCRDPEISKVGARWIATWDGDWSL